MVSCAIVAESRMAAAVDQRGVRRHRGSAAARAAREQRILLPYQYHTRVISTALRLCSAGLLVAAVAAVPTAPHAEAKTQILANWVKGTSAPTWPKTPHDLKTTPPIPSTWALYEYHSRAAAAGGARVAPPRRAGRVATARAARSTERTSANENDSGREAPAERGCPMG
eukprot:COSAG02_NODE_2218_length_9474_cov_25.098453_4_plen_169_part_00